VRSIAPAILIRWCLVAATLWTTLPARQLESRERADQSFQMALRLERSGNLDQALAIYRNLVDDFPNVTRYDQQLIRLLRKQQKYTEWLSLLQTKLGAQPEDIHSHIEVGEVYILMNQRRKAVEAWEAVLEKFPGNALAERLVLTSLFNHGFGDQGEAMLNRIREGKNDPAFFAMEMARLHSMRLSYDHATDEYLRYLRAEPRSERNVRNQLLTFPTDSGVAAMLDRRLEAEGSPQAMRILSSLAFKQGRFAKVIELYDRLAMPPNQTFDLALDLMAEAEHDLAEGILLGLMEQPENDRYHERIAMGLAEIHLLRSQQGQARLKLAGLFPGNAFFTLPFLTVPDSQLVSLRRAITLFDSMAVSRSNPKALLRLAEIKYRILDDFDGAIAHLEAVLKDRRARPLYPEVIMLLIDAWIAKGDLAVAGEVSRLAPRLLQDQEQLDHIELKLAELVFLSGNADSLKGHIGGLMAALGPADPGFNDLLELSGLVNQMGPYPETYRTFVSSERLLRQNRRSEAIALMEKSLETAPVDILGLLRFRLAQLHAMQGNLEQATQYALQLSAEPEYGELGLLLAAEVADYLAADPVVASDRYLAFLEAYDSSIYHDPVRLRYRTLNPDGS